jgi:hypothetical protein
MKRTLPLLVALLLATVGLFAQLQFDPGSVDFGQKPITSTTPIEVVITSQINQQVTLSGLSAPFTATPASFAIVIGEQKTITITFNPQAAGPFAGTLTATGGIWGTTQMQVTGYAIPATVSFSQQNLDFGNILMTGHAEQMIYVQSDIAQQVTLSNLALPFAASPETINLLPDQPAPIYISFYPTEPGYFNSVLVATGNLSGTAQAEIYGTGDPASIFAFPQSLEFSPLFSGETDTLQILITTDINQNIAVSGLSGVFSFTPANLIMTAGEAQTVHVSFNPTNPGSFYQNLQLVGSLAGSAQIVVYGSATPASIFAFPQTCDFDPLFTGRTDTLEIIVTTDINQNISLSGLSDIFSFYPENLTMAAGDPQTVYVIFNPVNPGFYNQSLQLTGSLWGSLDVPVSGECIYPMITVSPGYLDFGDVPLLSTATRQITILNSGNVTLECGFTNNNTHFGVSSPTLSIPENSSQQLDVTFTPDFIPAEYDTLLITTNDPDNQLVRIPLSGQGVSLVSGEVCGTWYKANSPYNFNGSVTVPETCTLTIEPGVIVNMFDYNFFVYGKLVCNGTVNDSIRLTGTDTLQLSTTCPNDSIDYVAIDGVSTDIDGMIIKSYGVKLKNSNIKAYEIVNGQGEFFYDDFEDGSWNDKWDIINSENGHIQVNSNYGYVGKGMIIASDGYMSDFGIQTKPIRVQKHGNLMISLFFRIPYSYYYNNSKFFWRVNNGDWNMFYQTNQNTVYYEWTMLNSQIQNQFQSGDLFELKVLNTSNYFGYYGNNQQTCIDDVKITGDLPPSHTCLKIENSSLTVGAIDNYSKNDSNNVSIQIDNSNLILVKNIESHFAHNSIKMTNSSIKHAGNDAIRTNGVNSDVLLGRSIIENASGNAVYTSADSSGVTIQNCSIQNCSGTGIYIAGEFSQVLMDSSFLSNCSRGMQIANSNSPVTISNSIISNNTNDGVYISGTNSTLMIDDSEIINNDGNGISCYGSSDNGKINEVITSNISGNKSTGIHGGHSLLISNSNVNQNGYNGIEGSQVTVANCIVNSNKNNGISASEVNINYSIVSSNKANGINASSNFYGNHITSIYNRDKGLVASTYGLLLNSIVCSNTQYGSQYSGGLEYFYSKVMGNPKLADSLGHLLPTSPCIDAADPEEEDANIPFGMGTIRSDMGAYGGPENWVWGGNPAPTDGAAKIVNIVDLPQDQGKMVGIQFNASPFDNGHPAYNVSRYSFWRELDENGKQNIVASKTPVGQYFQKGAEYWEYVGEMPAMGFQNYGYSAPTLGDSTINGMFWSKFIVVAHTANTSVYWVSLPDSGYSVDNLAPAAPMNLAGSVAGVSYNLQWTPNPEEDLQYYAVYRGTDGNFEAEPFATTTQAVLPNITLNTDEYEYAVAAFDHSGNRSNLSNEIAAPIYDAFAVPQGWSGVSSWIMPTQPELENVLAPLSEDLIILYNQNGVYWPGQNVNTLGDWESHSGYVVKLGNEKALPMVGFKEQNTALGTNSGWQILPILSACAVPTTGLQVQPASSVVMIKEIAGWRVFWPEMGIATLGELLPGKAYFALTGSSGTIDFPACGDLKVGFENLTASPDLSTFKISTTPATHIIAIPVSIAGNLEIGDAIAVFNSLGTCVGASNIQDKTRASALTVFGDDPTTSQKEGMAEGETLHFKVYKSGTGDFADAEVSFEPAFPNPNGTFATNGVSAIASLKTGALLTSPTEIENIQVFPNPGNGKFTVSGISAGNRLEVTDAKGQIIWTGISSDETEINLSGQQAGLYFLKISKADKISFVKLVIE